MPAKHRNIARQFASCAHTQYPNLLVSGCSYTWNNSESCAVTWPYYLRDLAAFDQVWDVSQPASGYNHTHTAVVTELETNTALTPETTLVIIMWSGLERVDITADQDLVETWTNMPLPDLGWNLSTLGLHNTRPDWLNRLRQAPNALVEQLRVQYQRLISRESQQLESAVKLISLAGYLANRGFESVFVDWDDTRGHQARPGMDPWAQGRFADIETLGSWASRTGQRLPDRHPSPDAHLSWTREHLLPWLIQKDLVRTS